MRLFSLVPALALVALAACSGTQSSIPAAPEGSALANSAGARALAAKGAAVVATVPMQVGASLRDLGRAPTAATLDVALTLKYRNDSKLDRLVEQQNDPKSGLYHHWLTNAQFNARFAPSERDYARAIASLRHAGLNVTQTYDNRTVIDARGSVAVLQRYFGTQIHRVAQKHVGTRYMNVRPAYAPADLRNLLLSVDGLSTLVLVHPAYATVRGAVGRGMHPQAKQGLLFGPVSSGTGLAGYGPLAFRRSYDMPSNHKNAKGVAYDGAGRAGGIVIDADILDSDVTAYLNYFHIKRTAPTQHIFVDGGPPRGDASTDSVEATLDTTAIAGNAPGATIRIYEIPQLVTQAITDGYNRALSDNDVDALNSSFSGCEETFATTAQAWNKLAEQAAAKGISFSAATGDAGGGLCTGAPADSPYAAAIGGTSLVVGTGGSYGLETAWGGSGGGVSDVLSRPSWQQGVSGTIDRGRNLPDIALDGDPLTGMALYYAGSWNSVYNPIGGTSMSSPLFVAAVLGLDQVKGGRTGLSSELLFKTWETTHYTSGKTIYFRDITQGNNGLFDAVPGYDMASGIGSFDAWNVGSKL